MKQGSNFAAAIAEIQGRTLEVEKQEKIEDSEVKTKEAKKEVEVKSEGDKVDSVEEAAPKAETKSVEEAAPKAETKSVEEVEVVEAKATKDKKDK